MKKVMSTAASILFLIFALVAFGLMISLSYSAVARIFPNDAIKPLWGVAMADVAALVWMLVFAFKAKGFVQRAAAALNFLLALAGTLALVSLETIMAGQDFISVGAQYGQWLVYLFIGLTACNIIGVYAHHLTDPEVLDEIEQRSDLDEVLADARRQARESNQAQLAALGAVIAARYRDDILVRLGIPVAPVVIEGRVSPSGQDDANAGVPAPALTQDDSLLTPFKRDDDKGEGAAPAVPFRKEAL